MSIDTRIPFSNSSYIYSSRQLPVPAAIDVAEVLEHESEPGAQPALQGAWPPQVLASGDHG